MSPSLTDYRIIAYGGPLSGRSFSDLMRERFSGIAPTAEPEGFPFVSNLELWLRADDLDLADGDKVAVWPDSSGNAFDATQVTDGNKPIFKEDILNGRPVIRFDGGNDYLALSGGALDILKNVSGATAFLVVDVNDSALDKYMLFFSHGTSAGSNRFGIRKSTTNILVLAIRALDTDTAAGPTGGGLDTNPHVLTVRINYVGAQAAAYRDGGGLFDTSIATTAGNTSNTSSLAAFIGALTGAAGFMNGDMAEILLYNRALATNERKAVERYLGTKYGIAVA